MNKYTENLPLRIIGLDTWKIGTGYAHIIKYSMTVINTKSV